MLLSRTSFAMLVTPRAVLPADLVTKDELISAKI